MISLLFFDMQNPSSNEIWLALIAGASGILGTLGVGKVIPAILKAWEEYRRKKSEQKEATKGEVQKLIDRIDKLERELDLYRRFETQTRSTLNSMLPLMKIMMKDHPDYVALLVKLENNIMGDTFSAQGDKYTQHED